MKRYKFSRQINKDFSIELRKRVNAYFSENKIERSGNAKMKLKTVSALFLYLGPFAAIIFAGFESLAILWALWIVMGVGKAFMGTSVMHDALHGSMFDKKNANRLFGFSSVALGADARMWKIQHNHLHHTYTNVENGDEDIQVRYLLRFSPNQPRYWYHRYQHVYAVFFYAVSTFYWATGKDFMKLAQYKEKGFVKTNKEYLGRLSKIIFGKILYFSVFLVLPMLLVNVPIWLTFLMFMSMHVVAGIALSITFQLAHVVPSSEFVIADGEDIKQNWSVHQLLTTCNFAPKSKIVGWFTGGLNFQIEHHLFPNICHIHYPKLSKIVQETAAEYNIPYHMEKTFFAAVRGHFKMLRDLGRIDPVPVPVSA
jgi:linoleoyl-CoA desaturase